MLRSSALERRPHPAEHVVVAVCAVALAVTYRWTWHLWQVRPDGVPNLAGLGLLRHLTVWPALLISCALMIVAPRIGTTLNVAVLATALAADQIRIQPEVVSLALLALAAAWSWRRIACAHFASMWFWAGLNKVLSHGWPTGGAPFIADSVHLGSHAGLIVWGVPAAELAIGLAALPALRRRLPGTGTLEGRLLMVAGLGGAALHLGILVTLSPWLASHNSAVWPWNAALAICAPLLLVAVRRAPATEPSPDQIPAPAPDTGLDPPVTPPVTRAANRTGAAGHLVSALIIVLWVAPAGFYVGLGDAYLSHNLYTLNTEQAQRCRSNSCRPFGTSAYPSLNVPVPPETRIYDAWFQKVCLPGETLRIIRPANRVTGERRTERSCSR
jgi:hypothetical protein